MCHLKESSPLGRNCYAVASLSLRETFLLDESLAHSTDVGTSIPPNEEMLGLESMSCP